MSPVPFGASEESRRGSSWPARASPSRRRSRNARSVVFAVFGAGTEVPAPPSALPQVTVRPRARRKGLRQTPTEAGERRCPRRVCIGRSRRVFDEAALSGARNRSCEHLSRAPPSERLVCLPTEVDGRTGRALDGCLLPDRQPKLNASTRHIAKDPTTPPVGFGLLPALAFGRSLRRLT